MKLDKIEITNFRCFESLVLPLHPEVNVIVGANGAGKSSILDAIAIALWDVVAANGSASQRRRDSQRVSLQPSDIHIAPGAESSEMGRRDFVHLRTTASQTYLGVNLEWNDHIQYRPPNGFQYDQSGSRDVSQYFHDLWQEIKRSDSKALIPLPVVAYYRSDRRLTKMPDMGNIFGLELSRTGAYDQALNAGANPQTMCQWFYLRENAELRQKVQVNHDRDFVFNDLQAVRKALLLALEGAEHIFFDDNPPSLKVALTRGNGVRETFELEQLSDGYRSLLALVLDFARRLAQAHPHWEDPLTAPGILLIDEVELHLHPRWQQTVLTNLRKAFPNTQIIVSTHSPAVLSTVHREGVQILTSEHKLVPVPEDVGTYGALSSHLLTEIFGAQTRAPETINDDLRRYLELVENQAETGEEGARLRRTLEAALGTSDADLKRADLRIKQLQFLKARK